MIFHWEHEYKLFNYNFLFNSYLKRRFSFSRRVYVRFRDIKKFIMKMVLKDIAVSLFRYSFCLMKDVKKLQREDLWKCSKNIQTRISWNHDFTKTLIVLLTILNYLATSLRTVEILFSWFLNIRRDVFFCRFTWETVHLEKWNRKCLFNTKTWANKLHGFCRCLYY